MKILRSAAALAVGGGLAVSSLGLASGVASAAPAGTASASSTPAPAATAWPAEAEGHPVFRAGSALGYYLWHNSAGWHLEVTHPGHDHVVFSGYVTSNGRLYVRRVDDERSDIVRVGPERHVMSFAFNNYGYLDGVHFWTEGGTRLTFHLSVDGHPVAVSSVDVGARSANPLRVPFTLTRSA